MVDFSNLQYCTANVTEPKGEVLEPGGSSVDKLQHFAYSYCNSSFFRQY